MVIIREKRLKAEEKEVTQACKSGHRTPTFQKEEGAELSPAPVIIIAFRSSETLTL